MSSASESLGAQYAKNGIWVVSAQGDLDLRSLPPLRHALEGAAHEHEVVVLDAGAVTFTDSSALNLLLTAHRLTTLRIAAAPDQLRELLEITGTDQVLHLYPTLDEALNPTG
ncbi:hypothetical protein GCM10010329_77680 [Streptomyces spiroverticillatus]|uniref:STAS domain-containing protein n=1 Tax=Streptomyces finlayi TaxID=67296 RepID=A0A918X5D3_9ACTN|nr:STAS domain-containing protein [Streptomyces finlayi]GHA43308.1 hypothetical protein GCM10010329_77680 [Streptomyces spiroverticillatus]GHD13457.1 hypothetical protein GCM10010334_71670 [Streptomyces finlayi]